MWTRRSLGLSLLLSLTLAAPAWARVYVNKKVGFKISLPKNFVETLPAKYFMTRFCVAAFKHKKGVPTGEGYFYKPYMFCFFFPARMEKIVTHSGNKEKEKVSLDDLQDLKEAVQRLFYVPYKNFDELARYQIKGFYFGKETHTKINGWETVIKEMRFEKGRMVQQRWLAALYNVNGDQFAVVLTGLESKFKKNKSKMIRIFRSFKVLDKKKGLTYIDMKPPVETVSDGALTEDERKLPVDKRNKVILAKAEKVLAKKIESLPRGWSHIRTPHYLVLSHVDQRFTKQIADRAEAVHAWLDKEFGDLSRNVVAPGVIRIYKDLKDVGDKADGWIVYRPGAILEINVLKNSEYGDRRRSQWHVTEEIIDKWFTYKNVDLWKRMPAWMTAGIVQYLTSAQLKGRRLVFRPDPEETTALKEAFNTDKRARKHGNAANNVKPLKELVRMTERQASQGGGYQGYYFFYQSGSFIRFLLDGPGKRMKKTKGILKRYIQDLLREIQEVEKEVKAEQEAEKARQAKMANMSEEEKLKAEDEAYRKRRKQAVDARQKEILERVFKRTFGALTDRDWDYIQKKWEKFAGK